MSNQASAETVARKIVRQKERRESLLGQTPTSSHDMATRASRLAHIEGRIDGLTEALEVILGVDAVTYDVIERLNVAAV